MTSLGSLTKLQPRSIKCRWAAVTLSAVTTISMAPANGPSGRRRPAFSRPVPFLVIAGGIIAPIAALLGWFDAIGADPDPLLTVHRWLGVAIGIGGLGLALFAWRRPEGDRGSGMIIGLAVITAAIAVQGWYGGAMVHGMDHMNW